MLINQKQTLPIILTGPKECEAYFKSIDQFVAATLGPEAQALYEIIVDDPVAAAQRIKSRQAEVREYRKATGDSYHFNWSLKIEPDFQRPFAPTHENMANLNLNLNQPKADLAAALRRAFSGIVAGNVKAEGLEQIRAHGPFKINGDPNLMTLMDELLQSFVAQGRMKLPGTKYEPCYQVVI